MHEEPKMDFFVPDYSLANAKFETSAFALKGVEFLQIFVLPSPRCGMQAGP